MDVPSGRSSFARLPLENSVHSLTFRPDGRALVTGYSKGARLWDMTDGRLLAELPHQGLCEAVAFTLDGRTVMTGGQDRVVRFWDGATGRPLGEPIQLPGSVWRILPSPDGRSIATLESGTRAGASPREALGPRDPPADRHAADPG